MLDSEPVNGASLLITSFVERLASTYEHMYGKDFPKDPTAGRRREVIETCATAAAQLIAVGADTPYHDLEHTVDVTLTMQEILLGKSTFETVTPSDWFNAVLAAVYHDIGYVPQLFKDDSGDFNGAALTKGHVQRSMRYVMERFAKSDIVNGEVLAAMIEYTSVPIIKADDTESYGALVRAADYIGQLANTNIRRRNQALLYEFRDIGFAEKLGYTTLADVIRNVPHFFESQVHPIIGPALRYLGRTIPGQRKANELFGVIKQCEIAARAKTTGA